MSFLKSIAGGLRALLRKHQVEQEMDEELRGYVDAAVQDKMRSGMSWEKALRAARVEMGSLDSVKEEIRCVGWEATLETLWQDIRYSLRMLVKDPGFTAVAVLTLALGIGANTAIFSVVNAVLLRPLPYQDSSRLLRVWSTEIENGATRDVASYSEFTEWKGQSHSFEALAAYRHRYLNLSGGDQPERILGLLASAGLLEALETNVAKGRAFLAEEYRAGNNHVVLVTDGLWKRRFATDPSLLGKYLKLDGESYKVIGILPAHFIFTPDAPAEIVVPLVGDPNRGHGYLNVIARLKRGISLAQAQTEMNTVARRIQAEFPKQEKGRGVSLASLQDSLVGDVRPALLIFLGSVGFVLLIACANVANLFLARTASRQKELAVRTTLGAGRIRLVRQLLTECVLVAFVGGTLGLSFALWGVDGLVALVRRNFASVVIPDHLGLDIWVLGFVLVISLATGILAGLAPALGAASPDLNETLKAARRGLTGGLRSTRLQSALVVSEVALALVLLIGAGLMIKSFMLLERVNPGLHPENILAADFSLYGTKYSQGPIRAAFFQQILDRINTLPGVHSASVVSDVPFTGNYDSSSFSIEGRPDPAPEKMRHAAPNIISPGYFRTLGIPLIEGRGFTEQDGQNAPGAVVINQTMARQFWPGTDPIGQRISPDGKIWYSIVGVAGDVRHWGLQQAPSPQFYLTYWQDPFHWPYINLLIRTNSEPLKLTGTVQQVVWSLDRDQPVSNFRTMEDILSSSLAQPRVSALLMMIFAGSALLLAALGIYGVIAYSVTQRTHEMGLRMALGAERSDVLKLVIAKGAILSLIGVGVGLLAALAFTRLLASFLYEVRVTDPLTFLLVSLVLLGVSVVASYIPARRATKVDPMVALRYE